MFDVNGKDNSTYNIENIEWIKKTSPTVGEMIEKNTIARRTMWSLSLLKTTAQRQYWQPAAAVCPGNMQKVTLTFVLPAIQAVITGEQSL